MRPYAPERRRGRARSSNSAVSLHECEMTHTVLISIDDDRRSERTADDNEIPRRISKATKSSMGMYLSLSLSLSRVVSIFARYDPIKSDIYQYSSLPRRQADGIGSPKTTRTTTNMTTENLRTTITMTTRGHR